MRRVVARTIAQQVADRVEEAISPHQDASGLRDRCTHPPGLDRCGPERNNSMANRSCHSSEHSTGNHRPTCGGKMTLERSTESHKDPLMLLLFCLGQLSESERR